METTTMITKLTGQTVIAMPSSALVSFGSLGTSTFASQPCGAVVSVGNGLGLNGLGLNVLGLNGLGVDASGLPTVSGVGNTDGATDATFGGGRELRSERPIQAPKAAVAAAEHGGYAQVIGAGAKKHEEQQIDKAKAAFTGVMATRMWAFRGPQPWRERT